MRFVSVRSWVRSPLGALYVMLFQPYCTHSDGTIMSEQHASRNASMCRGDRRRCSRDVRTNSSQNGNYSLHILFPIPIKLLVWPHTHDHCKHDHRTDEHSELNVIPSSADQPAHSPTMKYTKSEICEIHLPNIPPSKLHSKY